MHHLTLIAPLNCSSKEHNPGQDRCPRCNQWHLRAGYCQALNRETETEKVSSGVSPWDEAGVSKATWYRKKRAGTLSEFTKKDG
jgi:hypothetical protein